MKQKLALACTLVHEPALIVLDEPTTGVDPVSRREFWKLLSEFLAQGITIVMATPYLDEAERCARVALLHEGRLLALDTPGGAARDAARRALRGHRPRSPRAAATSCRRCRASTSVQMFGERAHVAARAGRRARGRLRLARRARRPPASRSRACAPIAPSLEDVFIARLRQRRGHEANASLRRRCRRWRSCWSVGRRGAGRAAASRPRPLSLTLDEAIRARARDEPSAGGGARRAAKRPRRSPTSGTRRRCRRWRRRPATRARTTSSRSACRAPNNQLRRHLSRRPRQLPHAARCCSGRSTPADGSRRSSEPRAAMRRSAAEDAAAVAADLRLEITRAYWALVTADEARARVVDESLARHRRAPGDVREPARRRPRPAERRADRRGAGVAAAMLSIQARSTRDVAEAELARLIGVAARHADSAAPTSAAAPPDVRRASTR